MSSTPLPVLGVVRMSQPVHGYDVRRSVLTGRADVNPGSIYHALKTALPRDEVLAVMRSRIAQVDAAMAVHQFVQNDDLDAGHTELLTLKVALAEAEASWREASSPASKPVPTACWRVPTRGLI